MTTSVNALNTPIESPRPDDSSSSLPPEKNSPPRILNARGGLWFRQQNTNIPDLAEIDPNNDTSTPPTPDANDDPINGKNNNATLNSEELMHLLNALKNENEALKNEIAALRNKISTVDEQQSKISDQEYVQIKQIKKTDLHEAIPSYTALQYSEAIISKINRAKGQPIAFAAAFMFKYAAIFTDGPFHNSVKAEILTSFHKLGQFKKFTEIIQDAAIQSKNRLDKEIKPENLQELFLDYNTEIIAKSFLNRDNEWFLENKNKLQGLTSIIVDLFNLATDQQTFVDLQKVLSSRSKTIFEGGKYIFGHGDFYNIIAKLEGENGRLKSGQMYSIISTLMKPSDINQKHDSAKTEQPMIRASQALAELNDIVLDLVKNSPIKSDQSTTLTSALKEKIYNSKYKALQNQTTSEKDQIVASNVIFFVLAGIQTSTQLDLIIAEQCFGQQDSATIQRRNRLKELIGEETSQDHMTYFAQIAHELTNNKTVIQTVERLGEKHRLVAEEPGNGKTETDVFANQLGKLHSCAGQRLAMTAVSAIFNTHWGRLEQMSKNYTFKLVEKNGAGPKDAISRTARIDATPLKP